VQGLLNEYMLAGCVTRLCDMETIEPSLELSCNSAVVTKCICQVCPGHLPRRVRLSVKGFYGEAICPFVVKNYSKELGNVALEVMTYVTSTLLV
jgi:hypothetical protein